MFNQLCSVRCVKPLPGIVECLGLGDFFLECRLVQCVLSFLDELADEAGESLLELGIVIKVVLVKPLEDGNIGVVRGLFEVPAPGQVVVEIDPRVQPMARFN